MTKVFLGVLLATVMLAGGVPARAQDKATIDSLNESFAAAFNKGDIATVAAMYTDDAFVLPPGAPLIQGRDAIEAFWKSAGAEISDLKLTTVDVKPLGNDAAREIGTFTLKTKGQQPREVAGKYVVVWEKVGANWRLAADIWNTNK